MRIRYAHGLEAGRLLQRLGFPHHPYLDAPERAPGSPDSASASCPTSLLRRVVAYDVDHGDRRVVRHRHDAPWLGRVVRACWFRRARHGGRPFLSCVGRRRAVERKLGGPWPTFEGFARGRRQIERSDDAVQRLGLRRTLRRVTKRTARGCGRVVIAVGAAYPARTSRE